VAAGRSQLINHSRRENGRIVGSQEERSHERAAFVDFKLDLNVPLANVTERWKRRWVLEHKHAEWLLPITLSERLTVQCSIAEVDLARSVERDAATLGRLAEGVVPISERRGPSFVNRSLAVRGPLDELSIAEGAVEIALD
jgi:hypothetical protein